ncbi:MAG: hypothetical protein AAGM38_05585 [Pseudomonadota bacterium]
MSPWRNRRCGRSACETRCERRATRATARQRLRVGAALFIAIGAASFGPGAPAQSSAEPAANESGVRGELNELRRGFAEWWNQPPGPSASEGFVRNRSSERAREWRRRERGETRALAASQPPPQLGAALPPPIPPAAQRRAAPASAPLPALRPLDFAAAEKARAGEIAAETDASRDGEAALAAPPRTTLREAPAPLEPTTTEAERRKLAALLGGLALRNDASPETAQDPLDEELEAELALDPATALSPAQTSGPATTSAEPRPRDLAEAAPTPTTITNVANASGAGAEMGLEVVAASSGGVLVRETEPAPTPSAVEAPARPSREIGYAAQATPETAGFFSDPTVRIGLAFLLGVGLLCLAFLREWSAARQRYS